MTAPRFITVVIGDCGSPDVQCTTWIYVNTGDDTGDEAGDDVWCPSCEDHTSYGCLVQHEGPWALDKEED